MKNWSHSKMIKNFTWEYSYIKWSTIFFKIIIILYRYTEMNVHKYTNYLICFVCCWCYCCTPFSVIFFGSDLAEGGVREEAMERQEVGVRERVRIPSRVMVSVYVSHVHVVVSISSSLSSSCARDCNGYTGGGGWEWHRRGRERRGRRGREGLLEDEDDDGGVVHEGFAVGELFDHFWGLFEQTCDFLELEFEKPCGDGGWVVGSFELY